VLKKNYFLEFTRNFRTRVNLKSINRKRLPPISDSQSSPLTRHDAGDLLRDQVTAGQVARACQYWVMSNSCTCQDGMSADGATVRMLLEIGRQDIPFARGASCHTIEG
jgi:hypothetical protein